MYIIYFWLCIVCLGLLVEAINSGTLVTIWFSAGATIPLIMSFTLIEEPWFITLQFLIFGLVTTLCLVFLRRITKKVLFRGGKDKTNLDMYIGRKYIIRNKIGNFTYIKFNGIEYSAFLERDDDDNELVIGDKVELLRFEGNKAIVKKVI